MSYIAKKKCSFGGIDYLVGDTIPHDAVLTERVRSLVKSNTIAVVNEESEPKKVLAMSTGGNQVGELTSFDSNIEFVIISIDQKDGSSLGLPLTHEDIQKYFELSKLNSEEAMEQVKHLESENLLILICEFDSRKTVRAVASERGKALAEQEAQRIAQEAEEAQRLEMEAAEQEAQDDPETDIPPENTSEGGEA